MGYDTRTYKFNNIGFLLAEVEERDLQPIRDEINEIKSDFSKADWAGEILAGNIEKEYYLKKSENYISNLLMPFLHRYSKEFHYIEEINLCSHKLGLKLSPPWVNFQKKYEFNPIHDHAGIFSFVIFIDIPYNLEDERKHLSNIASRNQAGTFNFVTTNSLGKLVQTQIQADKKFNNKLLVFPSKMPHLVYPFYTSDEYRITVSGNFIMNAKDIIED
jgi:hypothetical protein